MVRQIRPNARRRRARRALGILALLATPPAAIGCAHSSPPPLSAIAGEHMHARLVADARELIPGTRHLIGVLFTPDPGWHTYGNLRSDSGLPLLLRPSAPPGYTFEAAVWPAPERLVSSGSILDDVYTHEVTILLPLEVPADAPAGGTVTLRCHVEWLVCNTGCIPGQGELALTLPVGRAGERIRLSADEVHIRRALARVPVAPELMASDATLSWKGDAWEAHVPGASGLAFLADTTCAPLADPIADGSSATDRLHLRLAPEARGDLRLAGVLEVKASREEHFYRIDSPRTPAASTAVSAGSNP